MEIILSMTVITNENIIELEHVYKEIILPCKPGDPITFEVGKVIVTQTINTIDLFDERFGGRHRTDWLCTRAELDAKFNIVENQHKTHDFAIITKK